MSKMHFCTYWKNLIFFRKEKLNVCWRMIKSVGTRCPEEYETWMSFHLALQKIDGPFSPNGIEALIWCTCIFRSKYKQKSRRFHRMKKIFSNLLGFACFYLLAWKKISNSFHVLTYCMLARQHSIRFSSSIIFSIISITIIIIIFCALK